MTRRTSRWNWKLVVLAVLGAWLLSSPGSSAKIYLSQEEALKVAFPSPALIERKTLYLDDAQAEKVERESRTKVPGRVFPYYVGRKEGALLGYAYFDTHLVRTLPETIMVLLSPAGEIQRVEILSFSEPEDYFPRKAFLDQFAGKGPDGDLAVRRGIRNLAGASLTAEAITAACRRILALHRLSEAGR